MNYASILRCDIANGTGFRVSLFVSGCARHCKGCFNPEAQDPEYGKPFDDKAKQKIFAELEKPYCKGLSLLGGDPMSILADNRKVVIDFCKEVKAKYPEKDIWMWTGYTYDELLKDEAAKDIFTYIDYVVDGPFVDEMKDLSLRFCGSSNQRILKLHPQVEELPNHS
ncbi:MAG: anaerobic ribonucleoside-triphosphate reductase activating protein [Prevotella sp.]|nr:anaerobic ribonucleoside-triphosphate reductase activating protein [Prevotella sp.]